MSAPLRIGMSACFFHADPERPIFKGKTLLYLEQSAAHWIMSTGALAYMLPSVPQGQRLQPLLACLDGLVLQAGSDVSPKSYGEEPLQPQWHGDAVRDAYEIELFHEAVQANKPVFGICRGAQLINVARGGTLYQDVQTQHPKHGVHRDFPLYDQLFHDVRFVPGGGLAALYPGKTGGRVNSVHHQAIKDVGQGLVVEAISVLDELVEAIRLQQHQEADPYVMGVQWHPEFQDPQATALLSTKPLLHTFLHHVALRR